MFVLKKSITLQPICDQTQVAHWWKLGFMPQRSQKLQREKKNHADHTVTQFKIHKIKKISFFTKESIHIKMWKHSFKLKLNTKHKKKIPKVIKASFKLHHILHLYIWVCQTCKVTISMLYKKSRRRSKMATRVQKQKA
jgi:hypothetical protein